MKSKTTDPYGGIMQMPPLNPPNPRIVWQLRGGELREGEVGKDIDANDVVGVYEMNRPLMPVLISDEHGPRDGFAIGFYRASTKASIITIKEERRPMERIDIVKDLTTRASNALLRGGIRTEEQLINGLLSGEIWIGRPRGCGEDVLSELCAVTGIDPAHLGGRKKACKPNNRKLDQMVNLVAPMLGALNLSGLSPEDRREWVADAVAVAEEAYTQLVAACTDKEDT